MGNRAQEPKMGTVSKLAAALGVDAAELVPELKTLLKEKPEPPKMEQIFEGNGFLTARMTAIQKRAYEIYNLYGTIRRVLFEGRKEERANALSQLIQQQGGNIGGKADPNSPEELETMKQQLAEIDKLEEVVLFKDDTEDSLGQTERRKVGVKSPCFWYKQGRTTRSVRV